VSNATDHSGLPTDQDGRSLATLGHVSRPFRQQADDQIVDRAAALFARHGVAQTSVQAVADAVGLSKTGLLHHFPSKDALRDAVLAHARALGRQACDAVGDLPLGPGRDRRAVEVLVDIALAHPGLVALLLAPATRPGSEDEPDVEAAGDAALQAFGVDPATADPERLVRVVGALAALAVLALSASQAGQAAAWRAHVVATSFDALGHPRSGADPSRSDQVEA
jgi:AcrR family transcriptional regulator